MGSRRVTGAGNSKAVKLKGNKHECVRACVRACTYEWVFVHVFEHAWVNVHMPHCSSFTPKMAQVNGVINFKKKLYLSMLYHVADY